ncbi:MAG: glycosyltransferase involved in cell wall biosynthesis [Polaribacter sp.]
MSNKLHILFICGWYPSKVSPTNGDFIQRHAEAVSLNQKVTVIHIITNKEAKKNIDYTTEKINGIETHISYIKYSNNPFKKIFFFIKAFKVLLLKSEPIDVVHLNEIFPFGIFSLYLKWFKKKPYIISEHFTGYHYPQSKNIPFLEKFISTIITRNASFICPVSNDLKRSMQKLGLKGKYYRMPNVVDTAVFLATNKTPTIFTITHISNMVNDHKNIEGIIRFIKKLEHKIDDFKFKFIGKDAKMYIPFAKKLGINLEKTIFIDRLQHQEIATNLKESNLFILFSNYENLPCVILEAFSCGIPVISTNVGGINEYFPEDFGFLIDSKDEDALLHKTIEVYTNFKPNKEKMHQYVEVNFSKVTIANQFSELYNSALNESL